MYFHEAFYILPRNPFVASPFVTMQGLFARENSMHVAIDRATNDMNLKSDVIAAG